MVVCSCRAVTDRTVRAAVASGAMTVEEVARCCGAGSRCGGCWPALLRLLETQVVDACNEVRIGDGRHHAVA